MRFIRKLLSKNEISSRDRKSFEKSIDGSIIILKEEISMFITVIEQTEQKFGKNNKAKLMVSSVQFILLSLADIMILIKYFTKPNNNSNDKNLFDRTLAIHYYEFFQDAGKILGSELEKQLNSLKNKEVENEFNRLKIVFKIIRKKYVEMVKPLRMKVSAHKERDITIQHKLIESVNIDDMENLSIQFFYFVLLFIKFKTNFQRKSLERIKKDSETQSLQ